MKHPGSYEAIKMRTRDLFRQIGVESGSWKFCIFLMVFEKLKPHAQLYKSSVANINHNFYLQAKYDANRRKHELPTHKKHASHSNNVTNNHKSYHLV